MTRQRRLCFRHWRHEDEKMMRGRIGEHLQIVWTIFLVRRETKIDMTRDVLLYADDSRRSSGGGQPLDIYATGGCTSFNNRRSLYASSQSKRAAFHNFCGHQQNPRRFAGEKRLCGLRFLLTTAMQRRQTLRRRTTGRMPADSAHRADAFDFV